MVNVFALADAAVMDEFALDEIGPVTYDPRASAPERAPFQARGIFDADHDLIFTEISNSEAVAMGHATTGPVLAILASELALTPKQGDRVTINGEVYRVHDPKRDGGAWYNLILKKLLDP